MSGAPSGKFSLKPPVPISGHHWKVLLLVSFAFLLAGYDIQLLGLMLPYVAKDFGVPHGAEGTIIMWARFGVLIAFPLAMMADRFGRRVMLLITILGSAITTLATAFAQNESQFIFLQAAVRTFGYAQDMISIVVIAEEMEDGARGWALGMLAASAAVGAGVAAGANALVEVIPYGWRGLYVIGALPIFAIAIAWRKMPETRRFQELRSHQTKTDRGLLAGLQNLRNLFVRHGRRFWALMAVTAPLSFGMTCAMVLFPTFMKGEAGLSATWVSIVFLAGGVLGLVGNFTAGQLADRVGRKPVFLVAALIFCGAMVALYWGPVSPYYYCAMFGIALACFFAMELVMGAWSSEMFPTAERSTSSGARLAVNIIGGGLALHFQSQFYASMGGHAQSIVALLPGVLIAAVIAMLFIPETAGKTLEEITGENGAH